MDYKLRSGDRLDWTRLLTAVPRSRRVVIDADGGYNDPIEFKGDYNHRTEAASREWCNVCDSLTDKICQPTLRPCRANVRPFLLTSYDPTREAPLDFSAKSFGMIYVGHSKFRWHGMSRVLRAIEPVRDRVGPVALVGEGWASIPEWAETLNITEQYYVDREYLKQLDVQVLPPVPYAKVIATMGQAVFNPVVQRPLFEALGMVTPRTFETPAAGTIPIFLLNPSYVREIFGERAVELVLEGDHPQEKIMDVLARPTHYADVVGEIRRDFAQRHTPEARLRQLIELIEE